MLAPAAALIVAVVARATPQGAAFIPVIIRLFYLSPVQAPLTGNGESAEGYVQLLWIGRVR
jgi:hypothetical protein